MNLKTKRKATTKLDSSEQKIEENADLYRPVTKKKLQSVEAIIERTRKSKNINIRVSEDDLEKLRHRSREEGLPYQTLAASILHKYLTNRLVDENAIRKTVELLRSD